jgi:thioredoxin 1
MITINLIDANYAEHIAATPNGLLLLHKKLCPHCLNMKKVIEKFIANGNETVPVMFIDIEENLEAMTGLSVERVPTLLVIKKGKVAATRVGLMNPRQLGTMYKEA